ncbi:hypothetical protein C8J57DRAFT_156747 [Mycena rebaudengoi]|nr:hypothetical protein C8J57DRAFT_156747 [Mycena rebaudengoi]
MLMYTSDKAVAFRASSISYSPDIPPELWGHIALFCSRQSIAYLSTVSRAFRSLLLPVLYGTIIDPPLDHTQSLRLFYTLVGGSSAKENPHAGLLIRELGVNLKGVLDTTPAALKAQSQVAASALKRLYPTITPGDTMVGSALRVLHWDTCVGIERLGTILGAPGKFPNLKELMVTSRGTNTNFNFVQIPGLEALGCTVYLHSLDDEDEDDMEDYIDSAILFKLAEAIQMLPSSSPLLHTLKLNLVVDHDDDFPDFAYDDLVEAINETLLPSLQTLDICIEVHDVYRRRMTCCPATFPHSCSPIHIS